MMRFVGHRLKRSVMAELGTSEARSVLHKTHFVTRKCQAQSDRRANEDSHKVHQGETL